MDYRLILIVFMSVIIFTPAFGQTSDISITTDSQSYVSGETIVISGNVGIVIPNTPIILQIFYESNQVGVAQEAVAEDGGFSSTFRADGPLWAQDGIYIVRASYGVDNISEITFNFFGDTDLASAELINYDVTIPDGGTFDIGYLIKGGEVSAMKIIPDNFSILVELSNASDGYLVLQLPNDQIMSKDMAGSDEKFIVIVYETTSIDDIGLETSYEELDSTSDLRTIKIPFDNGDQKIEIIGTWVVPEFGAIAGLVLAMAIISIIVLSAKTRLNIIPKI